MSDGELAFTSFERALRRIKINRVELLKQHTIHPTEKPIVLYEWILNNYAKKGDRILDTHAGSFSLAVAMHRKHFDGVLCEIDAEYFNDGKKRYDQEIKQLLMF